MLQKKMQLNIEYKKYSDRFLAVIYNITAKNDILELIKMYYTNSDNIVYLDIDDNNFFKYVDYNILKKKYYKYADEITNQGGIIINNNICVPTSFREPTSRIRIGRFIIKMLNCGFPEFKQYAKNSPSKINSDILDFITIYQSYINKENYTVEVVEGEAIRKAYLGKNYSTINGRMIRSCMSDRRCQKYLKIYVNNPQVCKLIVLRHVKDANKVSGRALLWKSIDGQLYIDNIYSNDEFETYIISEKANELGAKIIPYNKIIRVKIEHRHISNNIFTFFFRSRYPYMDNFKYFDIRTNILFNKYPDDDEELNKKGYTKHFITLTSVRGNYNKL